MSRRIRLDRSDRCLECQEPFVDGEPRHRWTAPGGPGMNASRRTYTYARHLACQAGVERMVEDSRASSEAQHLADLRAYAAEIGMTPEQLQRIAAKIGAPDPYGPTAGTR